MQRCLNKEQIAYLVDLDIEVFQLNEDASEIDHLLHGCINWSNELVCLTYFLSHILEIKAKQGVSLGTLNQILQDFFSLEDRIWLTFQQINSDFVFYLYRHTKDETLSLEESLIQIQEWLLEHRYV